jgi:hypothetical protein
MFIGTTMKRLLGANDGYGDRKGSDVIRVAILDEMNELARNCAIEETFMVRTTEAFDRLQGICREYSRRYRVMREALIASLSDMQGFFQRMEE